MVQLPPSPPPDAAPPPPPPPPEEEEEEEEEQSAGCPQWPEVPVYHGYNDYIQDGLICLKHKLRNLEKKKLKLEEYKKRLKLGDKLNSDQTAAVERLEELVHNLSFTRELHKTLEGLTHNLLQNQKKAVRREQADRVEADRNRLSMVLKVQFILSSLQQSHVLSDLLTGQNRAPVVSKTRIQSLKLLGPLLAVERDYTMSLQEQTDHAALVFLDLLEGRDRPVAGSTFKQLKEELVGLLDCKYFNFLPSPPVKTLKASSCSTETHIPFQPKPDVSNKVLGRLYPSDQLAPPPDTRREPPDCWDMELQDGPSPPLDEPLPPLGGAPPPLAAVAKPWRGAAAFIPKAGPVRMLSAVRQKKERKPKGEPNGKLAHCIDLPVEALLSGSSSLPEEPLLRKQHLEELMTNIHGSFNFLQESLLDGDGSGTNNLPRLRTSSSSPPARCLSSPDALPRLLHSTPLTGRAVQSRGSAFLLPSKDGPQEALQLAERKTFPSPPLYRRQSAASISLEDRRSPQTPPSGSQRHSPGSAVASIASSPPQAFTTPPAGRPISSSQLQSLSVFKVTSPRAQTSDGRAQTTQTADPRAQTTQTADPRAQTTQTTDPRAQTADRQPRVRRVSCSTQTPAEFAPSEEELSSGGSWIQMGRDPAPLFYSAQDGGFQQHYRRDERLDSVAAWNDSSQLSSPERNGGFSLLDSGLGDSMCLDFPLTPQEHGGLVAPPLYPPSLRVAFTAARTANFAPGNLDQPIVFDHLHSNVGGTYDARIGRFTAPVGGTYVFLFHILKLAVNAPLYVNLMCNEDVMVSAYANDGAPDHETASNHAVLPLYHGDQVWLRLHRGAIYGSTWKYSTFSGFLLFPD